MAYLPGNATRIKVKAVGDLAISEETGQLLQPLATLSAGEHQLPMGESQEKTESASGKTNELDNSYSSSESMTGFIFRHDSLKFGLVKLSNEC